MARRAALDKSDGTGPLVTRSQRIECSRPVIGDVPTPGLPIPVPELPVRAIAVKLTVFAPSFPETGSPMAPAAAPAIAGAAG